MGKEGDLWDDSALIKAFDGAISKYMIMHGIGGLTEKVTADGNTEENLPTAEADNESPGFCPNPEHAPKDGKISAALKTKAKIGETTNLLQTEKNPPMGFASSSEHVGSSIGQTGNLAPTNEYPAVKLDHHGKHMVSSEVKIQNAGACSSYGQEEHNQLLNKYYEIEEQRQRVLQQLNQYSNWNHQNPVSNPSTSEEYQAFAPQPYDTVVCYCSYGCQNWVVPCNSLPTSCSGGFCTDKNCDDISKGAQEGKYMSQGDPVKTAVVAAKRALSSLTQEACHEADTSAIEVKDKELEAEIGHFTESTEPATDLAVVLNAWYSAGFYTGKYLSEQSLEKR